jgi:hypothetical protein
MRDRKNTFVCIVSTPPLHFSIFNHISPEIRPYGGVFFMNMAVPPTDKTDRPPEPYPLNLAWFAERGCQLLPDDLAHLTRYLPKPTAARNALMEQYALVWREAMDAQPEPHRKQNAGRRAANSNLMEAKP